MTLNEKLATIQTKFKSKKSRFNSTKSWLLSRLNLNRKKVGLIHSANITSDQPKTFLKQQNPFYLS
jgi:hypothetical protein